MSQPITLEPEQLAARDARGHINKIVARAGTGKTFTLVQRALAHPERRFLFLAYNRNAVDDAVMRFPPANVTCLTGHSLARRNGKKYTKDKVGDINPHTLGRIKVFRENLPTARDAKMVVELLKNWFLTADGDMSLGHLPEGSYVRYPESHPVARQMRREGREQPQKATEATVILEMARVLWTMARDPKNYDIKMPHDGYRKEYQLSHPHLDYDEILLDEAQDTNPAVLNIVLSQSDHCDITLVGDNCQAINGWAGAENAMESVQADVTLPLTKSFRFGNEVAQVANLILSRLGEDLMLSGRTDFHTKIIPLTEAFDTSKPYTYIARGNANLLAAAIKLAADGKRIHFVGGMDGYPVGIVEDVYRLMISDTSRIRNPSIKVYETWDKYKETAEMNGMSQEGILYKLVSKQGGKIPGMVAAVRQACVENPANADVCLVTGHKSKGLEWDRVVVGEDFVNPFKPDPRKAEREEAPDYNPEEERKREREEWYLLYVAFTRGKCEIKLNPCLHELVQRAGLHFEFPEAGNQDDHLALPAPETNPGEQMVPLGVEVPTGPVSPAVNPLHALDSSSTLAAARWITQTPRMMAEIANLLPADSLTEIAGMMESGHPLDAVLGRVLREIERASQSPAGAGSVMEVIAELPEAMAVPTLPGGDRAYPRR